MTCEDGDNQAAPAWRLAPATLKSIVAYRKAKRRSVFSPRRKTFSFFRSRGPRVDAGGNFEIDLEI